MRPNFASVYLGGLILALVAHLVVPLSARAAQPDSYSIQFEWSFTDDSTCAFPIVLSTVAVATVRDFFDQDGHYLRSSVHVTDISAVTNPANQKSVSGKDNWINTFDSRTGQQAVHGLFLALTIPGAGVVVLDAGTIHIGPAPDYAITFSAGHHEVYWQGDVGSLCAALS